MGDGSLHIAVVGKGNLGTHLFNGSHLNDFHLNAVHGEIVIPFKIESICSPF